MNEKVSCMFDQAVNVVLEREGKLSNDPYDPGGLTSHGVSLRYLKLANIDINNDGEVNALDILAIDKDVAAKIYKEHWWDRYHYGEIKDVDVATKILDMSIWMGSHQAHLIIQRSINVINNDKIPVDGIFGALTLASINAIIDNSKQQELLNAMRDYNVLFIVDIASDDSVNARYKNGWLRRAAL